MIMIGFFEIDTTTTHICNADVALELFMCTIKYTLIYVLIKYRLLSRKQYQLRLDKSLVECRNEIVDK